MNAHHRRACGSAYRALVFCLAWLYCLPQTSAGPPPLVAAKKGKKPLSAVEGVYSYELDNGLTVLLVPEPSLPKFTVRVVYRVGSRHEGAGETGMAHLLEHMLFKGSSRHRDMLAEITARGAVANAETDYDATAYYETLKSTPDNLRWALDLEADRMVAAKLIAADLGREFSVVQNELEIGENSPVEILEQRLLRAAYSWHGYGRDVIGTRSDLEHVPIERLRAFYQKYYRPDNAILIVAGKFDQEPTLGLIAALFGRLPRSPRPIMPTYTVEPVQDGERLLTLRRSGDVQLVGLCYHGVSAAHPEFAAAQAAVDILTREGSGRAYRALVEPRLGANLQGEALFTAEPGALTFILQVPKTQPIEPVRDKLVAVVEELGAKPIAANELRRFQSRARKDFERVSADPESLAADLGRYAAAGDFRLRYLHRDRIEQLAEKDVQAFARRYFVASNRTVGLFVPTPQPVRSPLPESPNLALALKDYQGRPPPAPGEDFAATIDPIEARTERLTLPNGMKVALLPKRSRGETVHVVLDVRAGTAEALRGRTALLNLLGPMLERGTKRHNFLELSDELDRLRTEVRFSGQEFLPLPARGEHIELETTRAHLPEVLALLSELVLEPSFPKDQLEVVRKGFLTSLEGMLDDPMQLAMTAFLRRLYAYPADDARYIPTLAERVQQLARLEKLRAEDLRQQLERFHRDYWGGGAAALALVGDFDKATVKRAIETHFAGWRAPHAYERLLFPYVANQGGLETIRVRDKQNAVVLLGQAVELADRDPDYPILSLFGFLLGRNDSSRLHLKLREQAGSAYAVSAQVTASAYDKNGLFFTLFTCAPKNVQKSLGIVEAEIGDLLTRGPTAAELAAAAQAYKKAYDTELTDEAELAKLLAGHLLYDRTLRFDAAFLQRILTLTRADFLAAVRRHIDPSRLVKILAGDL